MSQALNRNQLDEIASYGCQVPGCTHKHDDAELYLRSRCHPDAGASVSYKKGTGILNVTCKECGATIVEIKVEGKNHGIHNTKNIWGGFSRN